MRQLCLSICGQSTWNRKYRRHLKSSGLLKIASNHSLVHIYTCMYMCEYIDIHICIYVYTEYVYYTYLSVILHRYWLSSAVKNSSTLPREVSPKNARHEKTLANTGSTNPGPNESKPVAQHPETGLSSYNSKDPARTFWELLDRNAVPQNSVAQG